MSDRHLHSVPDDEIEKRKKLLEHPAFTDVWGTDQLTSVELEKYIHTWENNTERGRLWKHRSQSLLMRNEP